MFQFKVGGEMSSTVPNNEATQFTSGKMAVEMQKRSVEARKKNKTVKDIFQKLLNSNLSVDKMQNILKQFPGLEDDEINYKTAVGIKQMEKALKGDINSAKFMFDYAGEKPIEETTPETKPPIVKIEVKDNSSIKEVFDNNDI